MIGFKHKTPIQIRFKDIDAFKHVNNANHFTYLEIARTHYLNDVLGKEIDWVKNGIILANATINYKQPILLTDLINVHTKCTGIGNKSFELTYLIVKIENNQEVIMSEASTTLVCYNYNEYSSILIPPTWKYLINEYEK